MDAPVSEQANAQRGWAKAGTRGAISAALKQVRGDTNAQALATQAAVEAHVLLRASCGSIVFAGLRQLLGRVVSRFVKGFSARSVGQRVLYLMDTKDITLAEDTT